MKKEFLKIAGVEKESDFYKLFPTEEAFFGMYPEAKKLVQKAYGSSIKLPKAQGGGGSSMKCTSTGCKISEPGALDDIYAASLFKPSVQKEVPEFQSLVEGWIPKDERSQYSKDANKAFGIAASRRYQNMIKNPQYVSSEGNYIGPIGANQNFYNLMSGLYKAKITTPEMLSEWAASQGEEGTPINQLINKNYYTQLQVPTQTPIYFKKGGLVKYQSRGEIVNIPIDPSDVELLKNQRQKIINYFTGRMNFQNPDNPERAAQIRKDAEQILGRIKETPENYESLIQYRTPKWFGQTGVAGRYEPNKKDPSKDVIALYDPRIKTTDDYIKYYYPNDQKAVKYINQNRPTYDMFIREGSKTYPRVHEGIHRDFQRSLIPVLNREDNANLIYKSLTSPKTFEKLVTKRNSFLNPFETQDKVVPLTREQKQVVRDKYGWIAGESQRLNIGSRGPASESLPISDTIPFSMSKMQPQEWAQARQQLYEQFNIDPSKPITADQLRSIDEQSYNLYKSNAPERSSSANPETYHINEHIQDLFDVHGKDYKKMAELLNSVVYNKKNNNLIKAQAGLSTTGPISILQLFKTASKAADQIEKNKVLGNPITNLVDPTGITNLPYLKESYKNLAKSQGFWPTTGNVLLAGLETLATLPVVAPEAKAAKEGLKGLKKGWDATKRGVRNILTPVEKIDKLTNKIVPLQSAFKRSIAGMPKAVKTLTDFSSGINRGTRFFHGADAGFEKLGNYNENNNIPKIKLIAPDGSKIILSADDPDYLRFYNEGLIDTSKWSAPDSAFYLKNTGQTYWK